MTIAVIQSKDVSSITSGFTSVALDAAPTPGNTVIVGITGTDGPLDTPTGWDLLVSQATTSLKFHTTYVGIYRRVVQSGDTATLFAITFSGGIGGAWKGMYSAFEFSGVASAGAVDTDVANYPTNPANVVSGTVAATADAPVAVIAVVGQRDNDTPTVTAITWTGDLTEHFEGDVIDGRGSIATAIASLAVASYSATATGTGAFGPGEAAHSTLAMVALIGTTAPPIPKMTYTINGVDFDDLVEKRIRVELNDTGAGFMRIHRGHPQATAANLARGNIVSVTIPEIDPDPIFEWILESGDFDLISSDEEGGEILSFTGPGTLAILRRAIIPPISAISGAGALKLSKGIWEYTNGKAGSIIRRQIDEAQDRGILTEITRTFDDTNDSNGNPWNALGHWQMPIGANLFDEVIRLCAAGLLNPEMGPGLEFNLLRARGFTHTGTSFGTNVVRFVKGVNIASELARAQGGRTYVSDEWVKGSDGTWRLVQASSPPFRAEGSIEVQSKDPDVMDDAGEAALGYAEDAQDAILLAHRVPWPGDGPDEASGIYLPGQYWTANGNYWVGDLVTLHTGTGDFDFDNETFRVFAITIGEDETGYLAPPIVELNAPWPERDRRDDGSDITPGAISSTGSGGGSSGGGTVNLTGVAYTDDLSWKQPVRVATTANVTIATALNAGDTIDGVTLAAGDRVLVKNQSTASQNGIYQAGATPSRASDFDDDDEPLGAVVYVLAGTANGGKAYRVTNTTAPVVGTDAIAFAEFGGSAVSALDDLSDVTITTPVAGDRLRYTGSAWVNSALIWRPVMVLDPSTGNYVVLTTGGGQAVLVEA